MNLQPSSAHETPFSVETLPTVSRRMIAIDARVVGTLIAA